MIDYSHLFQTRDPSVIAQTIEQMDTASLMTLQNKAEQNLMTNSWIARWPLLGRLGIDTAVSAGIVALSQPLAKWRGWTTKSFGQYMKHPAALGAIALSAIISIFAHRSDREDANSVDIARLAEREMNKRIKMMDGQVPAMPLHRSPYPGYGAEQPEISAAPAATNAEATAAVAPIQMDALAPVKSEAQPEVKLEAAVVPSVTAKDVPAVEQVPAIAPEPALAQAPTPALAAVPAETLLKAAANDTPAPTISNVEEHSVIKAQAEHGQSSKVA